MITIYADRGAEKCRLFVSGHAEEGAERDIVCAGVSALTGAMVLWAAKGGSCRRVRYQLEAGKVFLSCLGATESFDMMLAGLEAIAHRYPDHLCIRRS